MFQLKRRPADALSHLILETCGATSGTIPAYPSGAPEFTPSFEWGSCYSIFSFMCNVLSFVLFLLAKRSIYFLGTVMFQLKRRPADAKKTIRAEDVIYALLDL
jgi:hypothetical protein